MISLQRLAYFAASRFVEEGIVEKKNQDILRYGIELAFTIGSFCLGAILFGLLTGRGDEVFVFLLSFFALRCFIGGYHADTPGMCWGLSITVMFTVLWTSHILLSYFHYLIAILSALCLLRCAPVVHSESPQYNMPRVTLQRRAQCVVLLEVVAIVCFAATQAHVYAGIVCMVLFAGTVGVLVKNN